MKRFLSSRAFLVLVIIVAFVLFNRETANFTPVTQLRFEHWLRSTEPVLLDSESLTPIPEISFRLRSEVDALAGEWEVASRDEAPAKELTRKLYRLLELAREASIFRFEPVPNDPKKFVALEIQSVQDQFKAYIPWEHVAKDLPTQTFLQLFRVYGEERLSNRAVAENISEDTVAKQENTDENAG